MIVNVELPKDFNRSKVVPVLDPEPALFLKDRTRASLKLYHPIAHLRDNVANVDARHPVERGGYRLSEIVATSRAFP